MLGAIQALCDLTEARVAFIVGTFKDGGRRRTFAIRVRVSSLAKKQAELEEIEANMANMALSLMWLSSRKT